MLTEEEEKHVFNNLSLIDMERVVKAYEKIKLLDDVYLEEVLFRDAVISYAKPFSQNKSINNKI